jgi:hypothetical protein
MDTSTDAPKDANLATLPKQEREALLDAERRDEMNEHTTIRVDGQKMESAPQADAALEVGPQAVLEESVQADQATALKPQVAETTAPDMGAVEEQVNRAVVPPPPDGESAPLSKEDTPG